MARRFFGLNVGQHEFDVTDAATTQTKDIELNVDLSKMPGQSGNQWILEALVYIGNAIIKTTNDLG